MHRKNVVVIFLFVASTASSALSSSSISKSSLRHPQVHKFHRLKFEDNEIQKDFNPTDEQKALEHSIAVTEAGTCDKPKVQVVHVSDHYPVPNKYYLPHCTLLHRCGKHAGCCGTDKLKCVAAEKQKVALYFYSVSVLGSGIPAQQKIEKLVFTNHTKCACVPRDRTKLDL